MIDVHVRLGMDQRVTEVRWFLWEQVYIT